VKIAVDPAYQRRGIAKQLVGMVICSSFILLRGDYYGDG
jgi:ribosomal protein S18 acetylase RimI-like enzyme